MAAAATVPPALALEWCASRLHSLAFDFMTPARSIGEAERRIAEVEDILADARAVVRGAEGKVMTGLDIRADLRPLQRAIVSLRGRQVPFAASLALNNLTKGIAAQESTAIEQTFDSPTPFTKNAIRMEMSTKSRLAAKVAIKDLQDQYLAPYVFGGDRSLGGKKGMLTPIKGNIGLNQYGNLTKGKLAALKAKPNVFIGPITFRKSGKTINGVWQRGATPRGARTKGNGEYGTKGKNTGGPDGIRTTLKLLIRFTDTTPVPKHLAFFERARSYVRANAAGEFDDALRRAFATAK